SVALATAAMASAAVNVENLAIRPAAMPVAKVEAQDLERFEAAQVEAVKMVSNAVFSLDAATSRVSAAEATGDKIPHYNAPAGVFYKGYYMCPAKTTNGYRVWPNASYQASPMAAYTWINTSKNATKEDAFTWKYFDLAATEAAGTASFLTTNTIDYAATADNAFLTFNTQTNESYDTYAPQLSIAGVDSIYGAQMGVQYGMDTWIVNTANDELFAPGFSFNIVENIGTQSIVTQTGLGATTEKRWQEGGVKGTMMGVGMYIPAPTAQYGVSGVMFKGTIDETATTDLTVTIYKSDEEGNVGEVLAKGKVAKKDLPAKNDYWNYFYVPLLLEDPDLGDVATTVNINSAIIVAIDGGANGNDGMAVTGAFLPGTGQVNEYGTAHPLYLYKDEKGNLDWVSMGGWTFGTQGSDDKMYIYALQIGLDLFNSWMNEANGDYAFNAPVAGGSKQFDIDALYRLDAEAGVADIYGEGMDDWYTVDMTSQNVMTVTVKALPEGTAGRSSELVVYTPGSERTFTITQGETTGVDVIGIDNADVINVEYFDLQGRKLNAQPENGIFIQKSLLSNGKTVATKVAK
ncbi:MAG: hypothetical protein K2M65_02130, partial [Muribaculaceae bacterium]|nr:hypothetical protein [Muribaculaceae bacterium]